MPLYGYECGACGHRFEIIQKFSDARITECPKCRGTLRKLQSAPAFQLKGTGWYATDYPKTGQTSADQDSGGSSDSSSSDKGAEKSDKTEKTEKTGKADNAEKTGKTEKTKTASADSSAPAAPSPKNTADSKNLKSET